MTYAGKPRRALSSSQATVLFASLLLLARGSISVAAEASRSLPANGLAAYVEYDGIDAHADAWKATAAYAMFGPTKAGAMVAEVTRQVIDHVFKAVPDVKHAGADIVALQEHVVRHGLSLGVYDEASHQVSSVVIINGLGAKDVREKAGRLAASFARAGSKQQGEPVQFRGRTVYRLKETSDDIGLAFWFEGDDLVAVLGPAGRGADDTKKSHSAGLPIRVAMVIDTIEGKAPSVATHPGHAAALAEGQDIEGFESNGLFFIEASKAGAIVARLVDEAGLFAVEYNSGSLPNGKYMHDDVQYFAAGPNIQSTTREVTQADVIVAQLVGDPNTILIPHADTPLSELKRVEDFSPVGSGPAESPRDEAVAKAKAVTFGADKTKAREDVDLAKLLGVDAITRIVGRWGFQGKALVTDVRVEVPAPRKGLMALLDQKGFRKDALPPIPQRSSMFLVGSLAPAKAFDTLLPLVFQGFELETLGQPFDKFSQLVESVVFGYIGQRLREDILEHLGPTWCLYLDPDTNPEKTDKSVPVLVVDVDDAKAFGKVLDGLAKRANSQLRRLLTGDDKKATADPPDLELRKLPAPECGYTLTSPSELVIWLSKDCQPTILLGEKHLVIADTPSLARKAAAAASNPRVQWTPSGEVAKSLDALPAELTSLSVADARDSAWPLLMASLPKWVQHFSSLSEALSGRRVDASTASKVLGVLGVPQPGGLRIRMDAKQTPNAEAIQEPVFPSVLASAVDARGVRFVSREAIPFACTLPSFHYSVSSENGEAVSVELRPLVFPVLRLVGKLFANEKVKFTVQFGSRNLFRDEY